jgi:CRISPR/Cas system-associated endonuclease Cas3-HD
MYFVQIGNRDDAGIVYWLHSIGKLAPRYHSHFYRTRAHPRSISVLRHVEMLGLLSP